MVEVLPTMSERNSRTELPADLTPSLVARLRAGDAEAGILLNQLYRQPLVRFCRGYLENVEEAEDATQEVFWKILKAERIPQNFRAYVYKTARNHCLNLLRARKRHNEHNGLPPDSRLEAESTGNLTRLVKRERRARIRHLLAALPLPQREALQLRYEEKLARAEIAEVMGIEEKHVKQHLFAGLKTLRQHSSLIEEE